ILTYTLPEALDTGIHLKQHTQAAPPARRLPALGALHHQNISPRLLIHHPTTQNTHTHPKTSVMSSNSTALVVGPSKRQIPTPPNTSRSSFSELPLSQSTARPMPKRLEQAAQKAGSEGSGGRMEDDDEEQGDDDDDDDEEEAGDYDMEDSFSQSGMAAPSAYARLDGASAEEAFTPEDDLFAVVEADAAREAEAAMHDLTGSISAALNQYRTQLWNGLSRLSDEIVQVEDGLRSGTTQVEELNGWVDGLLTPALAEILDVHSYLCESLGKVTTILGIYRSALSHIGRAIDSLLNSLIEPNNILNHINFPIDQTATWAVDAAASLQSTSRSITILCSISSSIQAHTQGGTAALSHPSNPVKHPSTRFCHAISY
ncbi:hypothetical protein PSHT_07549, partial [Puccinia striiformis]